MPVLTKKEGDVGLLSRLFKKKDSAADVRSCARCGGTLRAQGPAEFPGGRMPYYRCPTCSIAICNPCALRAGSNYEKTPVASPRCPVCHTDLRSTRTWS